jgi:hypothetical protein
VVLPEAPDKPIAVRFEMEHLVSEELNERDRRDVEHCPSTRCRTEHPLRAAAPAKQPRKRRLKVTTRVKVSQFGKQNAFEKRASYQRPGDSRQHDGRSDEPRGNQLRLRCTKLPKRCCAVCASRKVIAPQSYGRVTRLTLLLGAPIEERTLEQCGSIPVDARTNGSKTHRDFNRNEFSLDQPPAAVTDWDSKEQHDAIAGPAARRPARINGS